MQKIFSIKDLKANLSKATDCIIIPEWIFDSVIGLCNEDIEYSGQLLCYNNIAEYPFLSGSGDVGSVFPSKKIVFNDSPRYSTIEFHTHTAALGGYWTDKFSGGDLASFSKRILQEGKDYKHILFTPENILTWGKDSAPDVRIGFGNNETVIKIFNDYNLKHNCWAEPITKKENKNAK